MLRLSEISFDLSEIQDQDPLDAAQGQAPAVVWQQVVQVLSVQRSDIVDIKVFKRSFDARKARLQVVFVVDVQLVEAGMEALVFERLTKDTKGIRIQPTPDMRYELPRIKANKRGKRPVVIGLGPCGIFAALTLARMGLAPIVLERGKSVRERTQDTWNLWRKRILNPSSNVQFGEGGAGTFSDGKLYSQVKDPHFLGRHVISELIKAGAPSEIAVLAHPHIGTFKLVKVVENLRQQILDLGAEIHFQHRLSDIQIQNGKIKAITVIDESLGKEYELVVDHAIIALGHSARDSFEMLHQKGVFIQAKPFSIGFRIEHPQSLIDQARWGKHAGNPLLGAADYKLVHHASNGRSVYSFCMCPGGTVVAATSEQNRVVTNGMSQYSRNERNANAGFVVGISPVDFQSGIGGIDIRAQYDLPENLMGIGLQRHLESQAFTLGGGNYNAPAQLVGDFLKNQTSKQLGKVIPSYKPGITLVNLAQSLPDYAIDAMREAIPIFSKKIKGYDLYDAVLTGVETRTSSPLTIKRDEETFQSINIQGLYPAGEGAGYAGGILSAAIDGIKVAHALAKALHA